MLAQAAAPVEVVAARVEPELAEAGERMWAAQELLAQVEPERVQVEPVQELLAQVQAEVRVVEAPKPEQELPSLPAARGLAAQRGLAPSSPSWGSPQQLLAHNPHL